MIITIKGDKAIELSKIKRPKLASITSAFIDGENIAQLNIIEGKKAVIEPQRQECNVPIHCAEVLDDWLLKTKSEILD